MKEKTARRWLRRKAWKIAEAKADDNKNTSFWKRVIECKRESNNILFRKFN